MLKKEELQRPDSCWSKARYEERVFILLARDKAAPAAIKAWVNERLRLELNHPEDTQIKEAMDCARAMLPPHVLALAEAFRAVMKGELTAVLPVDAKFWAFWLTDRLVTARWHVSDVELQTTKMEPADMARHALGTLGWPMKGGDDEHQA